MFLQVKFDEDSYDSVKSVYRSAFITAKIGQKIITYETSALPTFTDLTTSGGEIDLQILCIQRRQDLSRRKKNINLYRQDGKIFPIKVVEPVFKPFVYAYAIRDVQITFFYLALPRTRRTISIYSFSAIYLYTERGGLSF